MLRRILISAMLAVTVLGTAPATAIELQTTGSGKTIPNATAAYRGPDGVWRTAKAADWIRAPSGATETVRGQNTINVSFRDLAADTGGGFDDPELGAQRRDLLSQVLTRLDAAIEDGGTLDLEVRESETDGSGSLASASTFYPTAPNGIHPGAARTHLATGSDPFPGVPDMVLTVDFGYNWNSTMDMPAGDEADLYSVLIHELTHGLGLISLSDSSGASQVSGGKPGVFSTFDNLLFTGTGVDLWSGQGEFQGLISDLTGFDQGVEFRGGNTIAVFGGPLPVHTPDPYRQGSSLAHWEDSPETNGSVMQPAIGYGEVHRTPRTYELAALKDLGYSIQVSGSGDETFDFSVVDGSWLNPQTEGEGIFLDYGPSLDMMFAAWFTFTLTPGALDDGGNDIGDPDQRWLTALLQLDPETATATGTLRSRQGGAFDAPPRPGESNDAAGTITIEFTSCDHAHVEYTIDAANISGGFDIEPLEKTVNANGYNCRS